MELTTRDKAVEVQGIGFIGALHVVFKVVVETATLYKFTWKNHTLRIFTERNIYRVRATVEDMIYGGH